MEPIIEVMSIIRELMKDEIEFKVETFKEKGIYDIFIYIMEDKIGYNEMRIIDRYSFSKSNDEEEYKKRWFKIITIKDETIGKDNR